MARALEDICGVLNAKFADLAIFDGLRVAMQVQASYGWPRELLENMLRHAHLNPALPKGLVYPLGEPWCGSRQMGVDQFRKSLYWRSCMAGAGTMDVVSVGSPARSPSSGPGEVTGSEECALFSDDEIDVARRSRPISAGPSRFPGSSATGPASSGRCRRCWSDWRQGP